MSYCGKPFCTCCDSAYAGGYSDGLNYGYKAGHKDGYISGYLDGYYKEDPLSEYKTEIYNLLPTSNYKNYRDPLELECGCYGTCTCLKADDLIPTYNFQKLKNPLELDCGCYGKCTCYIVKYY